MRLANAPAVDRGRVYLIGAGPGDPDLLTRRAVRALGEASVVLVDALVDERCLEFTRARIVRVGKRGGCRSTPQRFVERLMVRLAQTGETVARLKGGDPLIFGRGGEELAALRVAGIPVEIIPGVTAGTGAAVALGIALTQRGIANSVTFVTGHSATPVEWRALATASTTLVIYMGLARLSELVAEMLAAGFAAGTPASVVQDATGPAERAVFAPLGCLAQSVQDAGLAAPALIVVGDILTQAAHNLQGAQIPHVYGNH